VQCQIGVFQQTDLLGRLGRIILPAQAVIACEMFCCGLGVDARESDAKAYKSISAKWLARSARLGHRWCEFDTSNIMPWRKLPIPLYICRLRHTLY
jgi:hypothetical protein